MLLFKFKCKKLMIAHYFSDKNYSIIIRHNNYTISQKSFFILNALASDTLSKDHFCMGFDNR